MVNYSKGKIYAIRSYQTNDIYISVLHVTHYVKEWQIIEVIINYIKQVKMVVQSLLKYSKIMIQIFRDDR